MWIFCCGMWRSGSTLQFQITSHLVEEYGIGKRVEWVEPERFLEISGKYKDYNGWKVFKTHYCSKDIMSEFYEGKAKGVYVFRDLRDVFVSKMKKDSTSFQQLWNMRLLNDSIDTYNSWIRMPNMLVSKYEDMIYDLPREVYRIANHIGISVDKDKCSRIASRFTIEKQIGLINKMKINSSDNHDLKYDPVSLLHANHISSGSSGNWKIDLAPLEIAMVEKKVNDYLVKNGYELSNQKLNLIDRVKLWMS